MTVTVTSLALQAALHFNWTDTHLDALNAQLRLRPDVKRALFMAEKLRADFVFHTVALEGNPYTFPEVKTLLEGITVGGRKVTDTEQVLNLNAALNQVLDWVKTETFALTATNACTVQGLVVRNEALTWGEFRNGGVVIAGTDYQPPPASELPVRFAQGVTALDAPDLAAHPVAQAMLLFLWGSLNQFFYDGNKRTARLLANGVLMQAGLPPLTIKAQDQLAYNTVMVTFYNTQQADSALTWLFGYYQQGLGALGFEV